MSEFFIDQGRDKPVIELDIFIREFERKEVSLIFDLGQGEQIVTDRKVNYWKDRGKEHRLSADSLPILFDIPHSLQLFVVSDSGASLPNAKLIKQLYEEARLKREINKVSDNHYKFTICERRKLLNNNEIRNGWMIYSALDRVSIQDLIKAGR